MRTLPDTFPAEEKRKWEEELRGLWERIDKSPQESAQHMYAKRKLFEFSEALVSKLRAPERSAQQVETSAPLRPIPPLNNIQEALQVFTLTSSTIA